MVAVGPRPDFTPFFAVNAAEDRAACGIQNGTSRHGAVKLETEQAEAPVVGSACSVFQACHARVLLC